jgi:hypothetical protein
LPHWVVPPEQTNAHVPLSQTSSGAHVLLHPPQWAGSFVVSTQALPHFVDPPAQFKLHAPATHTSP